MLSPFCGATSHAKSITVLTRHNTHLVCTLVLAAGIAFNLPALAQQPVPLTLLEAQDVALEQEPGQVALRARADALEEQSIAAGELPDPKLRMGLANYPLESGGFSTEGMTQAQLGIRQSFPPGRTRTVRTRQFQSLAVEMSENADARGRDILAAVRRVWLEMYYWQEAHNIVSESRPFFSDLVTTTRSLYAVGHKDLQDVLRADLELSRLEDRLINIHKQRAQSQAALSEWVGSESSRSVSTKLPAWEQIPKLEQLHADLLTHPALRAADARIDTRKAGIDLAKERYKPGWALDLGYGYRDGSLPNGRSRSDFVSLSVTVDLPIFKKNRQNRNLAAAFSERRAANESKEALLRKLGSQLDSEYARWQDLSRRIDLYEQVIVPKTKEQADAALAAYQSGAGDFADVIRGSIDDLNTRLDHVRIKTDRAQSYAALANLGGFSR